MKCYLVLATAIFIICINSARAGQPPIPAAPGAYNTKVAKADFGNHTVNDGSNPLSVADFVKDQIPNLQNKQAGVNFVFSSTSLSAYHYSFYQTYQGIPIYQAEIKVNVSKKNVVYCILDNSYDISAWLVNTADFDYSIVPAYQTYLRQYFNKNITPDAHQVIAYNDSAATAELCYDVMLADKGNVREVLVGREGILYQRDARMYAAQPDSTVAGMVFNPDPITTADTLYGGNFINNNNSDNIKLTAQEQPVTFMADFENDSFYLSNQYIQMTNLGNLVNPVVSAQPSFNFTRSQSGFEDVMVFYHLNVVRKYFHDMGFTYGDTLLFADAHYTTADNSFFAQPNELCIGTGGVPDGQDCDVFVHEYTHFLSWHANGTNHGTEERAGLDEGTADYDATSYSRNISTYQWFWVFNWDGHNEFWPGRVVNSTAPYSAAQQAGDRYVYGTCWASSLMDIWTTTGRGVADSLVFETLYSYGTSTTLPQAAMLLLKTDTLLYNGAHTCTIIQAFTLRGVLPDNIPCDAYTAGIKTIPGNNDLFHFTAYPDGFTVSSNELTPVNADLYDITGRKLEAYNNITSEVKPDLPYGVYIIDVSSGGSHQGFKWVHFN